MRLFPDEHETIAGVGRRLRRGRMSCVEVLGRCLERINEREAELGAWVAVDRDGAHDQARSLDEELGSGRYRGPLHGIPVGIKDIIDVAGLPTAAGFGPWASRVAGRDAGIVASLRAAGAVILGKTVTTQFAWIDPPPTRNPWHPGRTPGGSSSGSAAAVAAGMCLGAIGTQTGGSIIRPASFCGVAGLKPTYNGRLDGILPFAPHLDHPGPIARCVLDLGLIFMEFLRLERSGDDPSTPEEFDAFLSESFAPPAHAPRLGRLRGPFEDGAAPEALAALEDAAEALARAGAELVDVPEPFELDEVIRSHRVIMAAEAAAGHAARLEDHADAYQPRIRSLVEEGLAVGARDYIEARARQESLRASLPRRFGEDLDALLMPAAIGPAPDPSTTGDPRFNSPWSFTGSPALSFPIGLSADGLPLALQLVEPRPFRECELIETARWCEDVVRAARGDGGD